MLRNQGYATVCVGKWHIGMTPYALKESNPDAPGQLYNLDLDPGETNNLYSHHPEIVERLKAQLEIFKNSGRSAPIFSPRVSH